MQKTMLGNNHKSVAPILHNLALANRSLGLYKEAKDYHEQALAINQTYKAKQESSEIQTARSRNSLSKCRRWYHKLFTKRK